MKCSAVLQIKCRVLGGVGVTHAEGFVAESSRYKLARMSVGRRCAAAVLSQTGWGDGGQDRQVSYKLLTHHTAILNHGNIDW